MEPVFAMLLIHCKFRVLCVSNVITWSCECFQEVAIFSVSTCHVQIKKVYSSVIELETAYLW